MQITTVFLKVNVNVFRISTTTAGLYGSLQTIGTTVTLCNSNWQLSLTMAVTRSKTGATSCFCYIFFPCRIIEVRCSFDRQGNGHERDFIDATNVYILDIYNCDIYPRDRHAKRELLHTIQSLSSHEEPCHVCRDQ